MNLRIHINEISEAEWITAWAVLIAKRDRRPVAHLERRLEAECGGAPRALRVLSIVQAYELAADIDQALAFFRKSPAPRIPTPCVSSGERRVAVDTATAARHRSLRTALLWAGVLLFPAYCVGVFVRGTL